MIALSFVACKDDPNPVPEPIIVSKVTVQPVYGGQTLYLDSTYTTVEGYDVQFTDIKFYMGSPSFDGGAEEVEPEDEFYKVLGPKDSFGSIQEKLQEIKQDQPSMLILKELAKNLNEFIKMIIQLVPDPKTPSDNLSLIKAMI